MAKMPLVHIAIFAILCAVWIPFDVNCETSNTEDARIDEIEAILQSVVRKNQELEIKMGHMEIELEAQKNLNSELKRRIEDLENEQQPIEDINIDTDSEDNFSDLRQSINASITKRRDDQTSRKMQSKVQVPRQKTVKSGLKRQIEDRRTVAFTAVISQMDIRNLGAGQSIVFDRILTNIRGAYHSTTGIFTTPVSGIYAFNVALMVNPGDREYLDIVKDGIAVMPIYCHTAGAQHYISPSRTVTLALNKGNEVWIRTSTSQNHGTGQIHGNGYTTFSGWLIDYTD